MLPSLHSAVGNRQFFQILCCQTCPCSEVSEGGYQRFTFGLGGLAVFPLRFGAAAAPVAFDPTFGAASSASGAADTAADTLLAELTSRGVIPSGMGSEAKVLLQGLMMQYQEV